MGNQLELGTNSDATERQEATNIPLFAQNMIEIGRIVSLHGTTPPAYRGAKIKFLESCQDEAKGFRAEVYLESDDPYMILVERGAPIQGILLPNYDHVNINYRPDNKTSLRVDKADYPESEEFERPEELPPGSLFIDHGKSIFLWMHSSLLGPKTRDFLNRITSKALEEFVKLHQAKDKKIDL